MPNRYTDRLPTKNDLQFARDMQSANAVVAQEGERTMYLLALRKWSVIELIHCYNVATEVTLLMDKIYIIMPLVSECLHGCSLCEVHYDPYRNCGECPLKEEWKGVTCVDQESEYTSWYENANIPCQAQENTEAQQAAQDHAANIYDAILRAATKKGYVFSPEEILPFSTWRELQRVMFK